MKLLRSLRREAATQETLSTKKMLNLREFNLSKRQIFTNRLERIKNEKDWMVRR